MYSAVQCSRWRTTVLLQIRSPLPWLVPRTVQQRILLYFGWVEWLVLGLINAKLLEPRRRRYIVTRLILNLTPDPPSITRHNITISYNLISLSKLMSSQVVSCVVVWLINNTLINQCSYSTSDPVSTWTGDCLWVGKPSWYVAIHLC